MAITQEELQAQSAEQSAEQGNLVERLQSERKVLLNKIRQEGFELGVRSAAKLSYKEFQHFERVSSLATALDEDAMEYLWAFLDQHGYPEEARTQDRDFAHLLDVSTDSRLLFVQGWIDGVLSVWQVIKAQVSSAQG